MADLKTREGVPLTDFSPSKKLPPTAPEAERSVLGCLLLDKDSILKIADFIEASDFYHDHHRFIFEAILALFHKSEPVDIVTVATKLQAQEKLELIGGPEYLAELQNEVPISTHIFQYAQIIKHRSTLRKLIKAGNDITSLGYNADKSIQELLEEAEKRVFSISQTFIKNRFIPIKDILTSSYERFCEINENPELANKNRISTSFPNLDNRLNGGFNPSDLIIVAARPSMGKTALALAIAMKAAIDQGKKLGIISLEMSKEQVVERMLCSRLEVDSWKLHKGKLEDSDFDRMGPVMDELSSASIFVDDSMGNSIVELRAKARRLQMEHGLDMLMVDYLQLMSGQNPLNRVQEISEISRSLKELARELHIPVIAISQLSRSVEGRPDKRPILSDLRDSGSIEQDADVVMMLYRDDYYNQDSESPNEMEINVIKHRNGAIGRTYLHFDRSKMKFEDLNKQQQAGF
ncbi:replicative DNA helicase [Candidatus Gracilibacteria bacterium]|nr:replicative DNA helicase [Candidatus Gracilibacteria bacterium]